MNIEGIKTSIFEENDNLIDFINNQIFMLKDGDIVVITSKIVALSQGRVGKLKDKDKLVKINSKKIIKTPWALLTFTMGGWCINAGIDESNARGEIILLPKNPFTVAKKIQRSLKGRFSLKHLGVLITDTKSVPLRHGTIGRALSYTGFSPLKSYIGKKDLFGRKNRLTKNNIADALSASAVLVMGEGNEQVPIVIIRNAPVEFTNKNISKKDQNLALSPEKDIYAHIYNK